ncbi:hypothetical protein LINGRAHAP2_LOCUS34151 [Linum grandiflorum]
MAASVAKLVLIFALCLGTMIQTLHADVAEYDDVWQKRAQEAKKKTMEAYIPDVMEVSNRENAGTTTVSVTSAAGKVEVPSAASPVAAAPGPACDGVGGRKVMRQTL